MKATTCIAILCDILSWRTEHKQFQDTVCDDKIDLSPQAPAPTQTQTQNGKSAWRLAEAHKRRPTAAAAATLVAAVCAVERRFGASVNRES